MAAASGVARLDDGGNSRAARIVPIRSMATDVEILHGDPDVVGAPFVMRIRELPGTRVPPHSHPTDEHITVVRGTWYFALGTEWNREALQEIKAGGYAFAPKGSWMYAWSPDGAIVQVHGVGPFHVHWRHGSHRLDDADAKSVFRFARGTRVAFGNRTGVIAEGYASGKIIQYEVDPEGGERRMVDEDELKAE